MKRFSAVLASLMAACSGAWAQVTLPATGVDVEDYVAAGTTALGTVVAAVVGVFFAFLIIHKGLKWVRAKMG